MIFPTFTREFVYDLRGRKIEEHDSPSDDTTYTSYFAYDAAGNLISREDAEGRITYYYYDALNRLAKTVNPLVTDDPAAGETIFTYDSRDNLLKLKDAKLQETVFTYDLNNRLLTEKRPSQDVTTYEYDEAGRLVRKTDAKGQITEYDYRADGRLDEVFYYASQADYDNPEGPIKAKEVDYLYDAAGNLAGYNDGTTSATYGYDTLHRKTTEAVTYPTPDGAETFELSFSYTYELNGLKKTYTGPDGVEYSYNYDAGNRLESIIMPNGTVNFTDYKWNRPQTVTMPGGTVRSYEYDNLVRVTDITVTNTREQVVMDYRYSHDLVGNVKTRNDYNYDYDELYRLTSVDKGVVSTESYDYDLVGNRTAKGVIDNFVYDNGNNELKSYDSLSFAHDDNGNTTAKMNFAGTVTHASYQYDIDNRMISVDDGNTATYYYDPFGRRLWKETPAAGRTYFVYADEGLVGEYTNTDNDQIAEKQKGYGWLPGSTWGTDPLFMEEGGQYYWYLNDHLGTPQKLLSTGGVVAWSADYDAFGMATVGVATVENNLRFPGQYYDEETGVHYNWHRYYDPGTGRYLTPDPIGLAGGLNLYGYVQNNPTNWIDPLGLKKFCTDWRRFSSGWIPTGEKNGVIRTRVLPSIEWFELYIPTPYKTLEHYYSEKWKEIVGKRRKCFEVDECGKMHEIDEVHHEDTGKTEWRDVTVGTESVPWNDPRLIPKPPPVIY